MTTRSGEPLPSHARAARQRARLGACLAAVVLGGVIAGCSSPASNASKGSATPAGTAASASGPSGASSPGQPSGGASAAPAKTTQATPAAQAARRCTKSQIEAHLTAAKHGSGQYITVLEFRNRGSSPCTMTGFPGFELVGPKSNGSTTYDPVRQVTHYATVTLPPGGAAHADFWALPGPDSCDNGHAWIPASVTVILPNGTHPISVAWPGGSVDNCQGGATHPGTYIGPVKAGT